MKSAQYGSPVEWHQDWAFYPHTNDDILAIGVMLDDMTLENGTWLNVRSKQGVYIRKDQQLDLSHDVVMYRDDGTTMTTDSATVAMKDGAASSGMPTHVEGPFGTIDATGFTTRGTRPEVKQH